MTAPTVLPTEKVTAVAPRHERARRAPEQSAGLPTTPCQHHPFFLSVPPAARQESQRNPYHIFLYKRTDNGDAAGANPPASSGRMKRRPGQTRPSGFHSIGCARSVSPRAATKQCGAAPCGDLRLPFLTESNQTEGCAKNCTPLRMRHKKAEWNRIHPASFSCFSSCYTRCPLCSAGSRPYRSAPR